MRLEVIELIENLVISNMSPKIVRGWEHDAVGDLDIILPLAFSDDLIDLFIINAGNKGFKVIGHWSRDYMEIFILCNNDLSESLKVDFFYGLGWNLNRLVSPQRDLYSIIAYSGDKSFVTAVSTFVHKATYAGEFSNKDMGRLIKYTSEISQALNLEVGVVENILSNRRVSILNKFLFRKHFNDKKRFIALWFYDYIISLIETFFLNFFNFQWFLFFDGNNEKNKKFVQKIFTLYQRSGIISSPKALYFDDLFNFSLIMQSKYTLKLVDVRSNIYKLLNFFSIIFSKTNSSFISLDQSNDDIDYLTIVNEIIVKERRRHFKNIKIY